MQKTSLKYLAALFIFCASLAWVMVKYIHARYPVVEAEKITYKPKTQKPTPQIKISSENPAPTQAAAPKTLLLPVPFTSQAPTANWSDPLYGEGCEEASALMAHEYYNGKRDTNLNANFAVEEIKKATDWELETFGYNLDINTEETVRMLKEYFGLEAKILYDFTEQDLKSELAQNHLVLFPANGRSLGNPNFRSPGPPYHMLVIKGYTQDNFVTNDPGTRKGLNYPYTFERLYEANGDFSHETHEVDLTKKMVIVVWK